MTFLQDHHVICHDCRMVVYALVNGWQCERCRLRERELESREELWAEDEPEDIETGEESR